MKTLKLFFAAAAILTAFSCQKELTPADVESSNEEQTVDDGVPMTFGLIYEDETKSYIDGLDIKWSKDTISIIDGPIRVEGTTAYTGNKVFTTTQEKTSKAWFSGSASDTAKIYYAVSPYIKTALVSTSISGVYAFEGAPEKSFGIQFYNERDSGLNIFIPAVQKPVKGSYDPKAHYLVGKTPKPDSLKMFNVGSLVKFTLATEDITEVIFAGNNDEELCGYSLVKIAEDGTPTLSFYPKYYLETFSQIKLRPAEGGAFEPGDYYICLAPTEFTDGIRLEFSNSEGQVAEKQSLTSANLERAAILPLGTVDSDLQWYDKSEILYLDYCNSTGNSASSDKPYSTLLLKYTPYMINAYQPFRDKYSFPSSASTTITNAFTNKLDKYYLTTGDSVMIYSKHYISPHRINGMRIGSEGSYITFPGKPGKYVHKIEIYGAQNSHSITVMKADSSAVVTGGEKLTPALNKYSYWYPTLEVGEGFRLCGNFAFYMLRVLYSDSDIPAPAFADVAYTRFVGNQCTDLGTTATLYGAFTMKSSSFDADAVECGFEYRQGSSGDWTSVTADSFEKLEGYYCYSADVTGLTAAKNYTWRAWVKGSGDSGKKYGAEKYLYPSSNNLVVEFPDQPQLTKSASGLHQSLIGEIQTPRNMSSKTTKYTLDLRSGYSFEIFGKHGVAKTTGSNGFIVSDLLLSPYHKDCAFTSPSLYGGDTCYVKLPAREGKTLTSVTINYLSKVKFNANLSSNIDSNYLGNGDIAAEQTLSKATQITLTASGTAANTSYYLCFAPDADATSGNAYGLRITKLQVLYE